MNQFETLTLKQCIDLAKQCNREIKATVVHCSATKTTQEIDAKAIDNMHRHRGWSQIGYNIVVMPDGSYQMGRDWNKIPAHVYGNNKDTLGICWVGGVDVNGKAEDNRTPAQRDAICELLLELQFYLDGPLVMGHRDYSPDLDGDGIIEEFEWTKQCPCYDVKQDLRDWINEKQYG